MIHHARSHPSQETKGVYKLAIVGLLVAAAFILGCAGFLEHACAHHEHASFAGVIYHTIQLFVLHSPHFPCEINMKLEVARYLAAIVAFYAVLEAFSAIFYEQMQLFFLRFKKNRTVICGLGRKGLHLAKSCRDKGEAVVVIEKDANNDFIRMGRDLGITPMGKGFALLLLTRRQTRGKPVFTTDTRSLIRCVKPIFLKWRRRTAGRQAPWKVCVMAGMR